MKNLTLIFLPQIFLSFYTFIGTPPECLSSKPNFKFFKVDLYFWAMSSVRLSKSAKIRHIAKVLVQYGWPDMLVHLMKAIWVKDGGCGTPWCPTIILSKKTISLNPVTVNHKCTWSLTRHGINHGQMPDTAGIFETGRRVETTAMMEVKGNLSRSHHRCTWRFWLHANR